MKKTFWSDAAIGGGVIGLSLFLVSLLESFVGTGMKSLISLLYFLVMILLTFYFAKRRSLRATGNQTFTYGQSLGYIVIMMLFAGLIVGVGNYMIHNYIAPNQIEKLLDMAIAQTPSLGDSLEVEVLDYGLKIANIFSRNIFFMILSGLLSTVLYGTVVGLLVSAFVKKKEEEVSPE